MLHCNARMQIISRVWQTLGEAVWCGLWLAPRFLPPRNALTRLYDTWVTERALTPPPLLTSSWRVSRTHVKFYLSLAKILAASSWERQIAETWLRARISWTWSSNVPNLTFLWLHTSIPMPCYQCSR